MPKVSAEHRDARRRQIAQAALRLFARQGLQATSVADIIAESGLSTGAIYGNYRNKDEIVQVAIAELLDTRIAEILDDALVSDPREPGEMIEFITRGLSSQVDDLGVLVQVWGQAAHDPAMRVATTRVAERLRDLFREYLGDWARRGLRMSSGDATSFAESSASLYVGLLQGFVGQSAIADGFDGAAYLAAASALRPPSRP
jgi:TetR/AcrR family transcriptional regulator, transcriptional repressor of aconitase